MTKQQTKTEESFHLTGDRVIEKIKTLIQEGNVRKIIVKDKEGKNLAEFPLTLGVVGVALAPVLAAIGALAALLTECTITVQKEN